MQIEFRFPDVGEGITEAEVVRWHVKEGDMVEEHQTLLEVETDKAVTEIPSPVKGRVLKRMFAEGDTMRVGDVVVVFEGESQPTAQPPVPPRKRESVSVVGVLDEEEQEVMPAPSAPAGGPSEVRPIITTPAVRRIAKELGIDLATVSGSGPQGRILEADVRRAAAARPVSADSRSLPAPVPAAVQRIPLRGVRKAVSRHLSHSYLTAVHVTHHDEADATVLVGLRETTKAQAEKAGVRLTYLPFIIKAVVAALKKHPYLNASLDDEKEEILLKNFYNIGIGVDTPDGLMVPVIKNADRLGLLALASEIERLATSARERKLKLEELKDSTFTISNVGIIGGMFATPIINHPESAILVTGKIADRPVVRNGIVTARKTLPLSLSFDHRIIDGAEAARFTNDLMANLQNAALLLSD